MADYDAIVIGGGPAGLASAIALAQAGGRVLVCERRRLPADKACGQGLMPAGVRELQRLGVERFIDPLAVAPLHGIRFVSRQGRLAEARFAEGPGWGMPRLVLSAALARCARATPGLELRERTRARPRARTARGVLVEAGGELLSARLLVGADGLGSAVRRFAGLEGGLGGLRRYGVRRHLAIAPWSELVEVHLGPGLEAYVTPCGGGVTEVALLFDRELGPQCNGEADGATGPAGVPAAGAAAAAARTAAPAPGGGSGGGSGQGAARLFELLLARLPALAARVAGAPRLDPALVCGPLWRRARAPLADGVALLGDAAGYLDALTGEGMTLAFRQARALARAAAPHLGRAGGGLLRASELAAYARAHRALRLPHVVMTRLALAVLRRRLASEAAVALLGRAPGLLQKLLSVNMGCWPRRRRLVAVPAPTPGCGPVPAGARWRPGSSSRW
ncbi:MAG: hypothetical protein KatS3mg102_2420 [Planctomycetota bacterium]|nr:MAG: hypothetical protein KatS3mg102_2420 [Planctomycetota bacterium]